MSIEKRLKEILSIREADKQEVTLREFAQSQGVSLDATYRMVGGAVIHDTNEVIRRIREAARSQREEKLWIVAITSAAASVISALASWSAVMMRNQCL